MKLLRRGKAISKVSVQGISSHGIWLYAGRKEYFLSYRSFPWFLNATVKQICHVELLFGVHLRWPDLDVDVELDALECPEKYPLTYDGAGRPGACSCVSEKKIKKYGKRK